jgi:hypothetical protein
MNHPLWIDRLEKYLHWIALPNLAVPFIVIQLMGFGLMHFEPGIFSLMLFDADLIRMGQVWRVVTFFAIPVSEGFFFFIALWFSWFIINSLESYWGAYRLSFYLLLSWVGTLFYALVLAPFAGHSYILAQSFPLLIFIQPTFVFALATLNPDFEILMIFIPVKMKWIGIITFLFPIGYFFVSGSHSDRFFIVATCINYLIYFGPGHYHHFHYRWRKYQYDKKIQGD